MTRRRLTRAKREAIRTPGALDAAGYMAQRIAGRAHVGEPWREILRMVYLGMTRTMRWDPAAKRYRRAAYLSALRAHARNRATYQAVMGGAPLAGPRLETLWGRFFSADLARFGPARLSCVCPEPMPGAWSPVCEDCDGARRADDMPIPRK